MDERQRMQEMAQQLVAVGRHAEAREHAGRALLQAPADASLHRLMAEIQWELGDLDQAEHHVDTALECETSANSLHLAARFHHSRERLDSALEFVDQGLRLEPEHVASHLRRALILADLGAGDPKHLDAATESAERATALDPAGRGSHYTLGFVAMARQDLVAAAEHLTATLAIDPEWASAHSLLGMIRLRQGMSRLASRHFVAAGRLEPSSTAQIERLRKLARRKRWFRRDHVDVDALWLSPEARHLLAVDRALPRQEDRS